MATPNIVPRADSEGGLGTASKYWASAYIDAITTTGNVAVGGTLTITGSTTGAGAAFSSVTISSSLRLQGDLDVLNKAQTFYVR